MENARRPDDFSFRGGGESPVRSLRPPPAEVRLDLREALSVVWRSKWSIVAITLLVVGVALLVSSRQTPIYESKVRILVIPVASDAAEVPIEPNLATEAELINSVAVAAIVSETLDIPGPPRQLLGGLTVEQPEETEILEIGYVHADPLEAQHLAAAFADAYIEFRDETAMEDIVTSAENIADQIDAFTDQLDLVNQQLENLTESSQTRVSLETRATLLTAQIVELHRELVSLPDDVTVGEIIQPAALPFSPVSPNHVMNGAFGIVAGLALGVGLAFLRDRLSERLRSPEEAEAYLEAPVLGVIPRVPSWRRRREPFLATAVQWRSPAAESYRVLRTNLLSAASVAGIKSIAVTSTHAGEGKSSTVANLGVVLAKAGNRVTIVSADLRRPRLHEFFQRESQPGLFEVLARRVTISGSLQEIVLPTRGLDAGSASLFLLPSGRVPEDPTELITSSMMAEVVKSLEEDSDIVLIDLPPVLAVTDALVVAAITKQVLLVIGPKASSGPALASARNQLDRVGARILGAVMNGPDRSVLPTYYS